LTFNAVYKFGSYADSLVDGAANGVTVFSYYVLDASNILLKKVWATSGIDGGYEDFDCGTLDGLLTSTITKPNNTGGLPTRVRAIIRCETDDLGYTATQMLPIEPQTRDTGGGGGSGGVQVAWNATSVFAMVGDKFSLISPSTSYQVTQVTNLSRWRLFLRVWK